MGRHSEARGRRTSLVFALIAAALALAGVVVAVVGHTGTGTTAEVKPASHPAPGPLPACGASCDPIDPRYLLDLRFGRTSFWIQPWRAYFDTWPAARLRDALGINFNVAPNDATAVAHLLHDSGFRLARMELPWDGLSYADPRRFVHEASVKTRLRALHEYGLRPLLLLNANSAGPCPSKPTPLQTLAPAAAGARTVLLTPASAAAVVPGRTGLNAGDFNPAAARRRHKRRRPGVRRSAQLPTPAQRRARRTARKAARRAALRAGLARVVTQGNPAILIEHVSSRGVATLSRPLPVALGAGRHGASTLLYAPFQAPTLPNGAPNPAFQATLAGWLQYVGTVARTAQAIVGPGGFDLEVWNELSFGSQFLNAADYEPFPHERAAVRAHDATTKAVIKALLDATVAYVRDPAHGIAPGVGISDGFASESPFTGGVHAPVGLTALSKHPYVGAHSFPAEYRPSHRPLDALGGFDDASAGSNAPRFVPSFQALFPEYTLSGMQTETLIRDVAPLTTGIYGEPHGRYVGPAGGQPLQKWITEYNIEAGVAPVAPDERTPIAGVRLTAADRAHFHAKALLRSFVANVNKGIGREYFFAAAPGAFSLVGEGFWKALEEHPGSYPGDAQGGEILTGFHNLLSRFQGPAEAARQLKLVSIAQEGDHAQFRGDGTAAHPSLYDREVLAVLPFQASPTRFVIPVYVMTRDLLTLYRPHAPESDIHRYDLPGESFRITLTNLPARESPAVSAYDPLSNRDTPARLLTRHAGTATIELQATDYPRLLEIEYAHG